MFSCFSSKSIPVQENLPPKPPKPGGSKSTLPANAGMQVVSSDPPVAPPKPKALQGRSTLVKDKKENFRSEADKKEILAMTGPSKGSSSITVPSAREEVSKDGTEKFYAYKVVVRLAGGKTHTATFRYSEFATFHKEWQKDYPGVVIEMPKKQLQMSDEDIARRCVELQMYLRELCEISALIYPVSKFLGVDETELKAAVKGKSATGEAPSSGGGSTPSRQSKNLGRQLPKVRLDDISDDKKTSVGGDKPKLPKVKLNDIDNAPARQESPPPPVPPKANDEAKRQSTPRVVADNPPPPSPIPKKEIPVSTPTSNRLSTQQSAPTISPKQPSTPSAPAIPPSRAQQSATLAKTQSEPVKAAQAGQKTSPAMNGAGTGLSVKERMAAFQKKN